MEMDFVCGVVEGFYGTPWRVSERKELFERLKNLELNTYMYAPKDDSKHRKLWREKYTSSEKEVLKALMKAAKTQQIEFVYAISPGLDIVFSSPADIISLKVKLQQVYELGCKSFALLFDDIDPELCLTDKSEFPSFGAAQIHVSNKVYEWFDGLNLVLFCPTEYCCTRAKPNVKESEYLQLLGKDLDSKIHIMWTGPKVVSQSIDIESINALSKVLQRKPVIWDNIHANDYDRRRVFLGPHKGLPLYLYEHTSGILKNPNCEFEVNFIAIHTTAAWLRIARTFCENNKLKVEPENDNKSSSIDKNKPCNDTDNSNNDNVNTNEDDVLYDSKLALSEAVDCWMEFFHLSRDTVQFSKFHSNKLITGTTNVNSLLEEEEEEEEEEAVNGTMGGERESTNVDIVDTKTGEESDNSNETSDDVSPEKKARQSSITCDDVLLLCELYYLPYEHGERGRLLLEEFTWLKTNAIDYQQSVSKEKVEEWVERAKEFHATCQLVRDMYDRFLEISNKRILEQLFPYIYDVKEAVFHLSKYVKWLGSIERQKGSSFLPVDPEAWFYRGGIAEEMERLLPQSSNGVLQSKSDGEEKQLIYVIRPYLDEDQEALYQLCRDLSAVPDTYKNFPDLAGDSLMEAYVKYCARNVFLIEVDGNIRGCIAAHGNGKEFYDKVQKEWLPSICKRHKKPGGDPDLWTAEQHMINRLHYPQFFTPEDLFTKYEGVLTMRLSPNVQNGEVCLQVLKCIRAGVKHSMSFHLNTTLNSTYEKLVENIGFTKVTSLKDHPPSHIILYGLEKTT